MKITVLHKCNTAVGLYRMWTPCKYLAREAGWQIRSYPRWATMERVLALNGVLKTPERQANLQEDLAWADLALYGWFSAPQELQIMRQLRAETTIPSIMDLDDDVFNVPPEHGAFEAFKPRPQEECYKKIAIPVEAVRSFITRGWQVGRDGSGYFALRQIASDFHVQFRNVLAELNGLTVSTPFLAEAYRAHVPDRWPIWTLPNCYDPDDWPIPHEAPRPYPTMLWAGSMAHEGNLKAIAADLRKVLTTLPDSRLVVLGPELPTFKELPQAQVEYRGWSQLEDYPRILASQGAWVGLAPAVDHPFNMAKSHIRWMEYALAGIPTICSPRPEYLTWAGQGAWFASETQRGAWADRLLEVLRSSDQRATMLEAARAAVANCSILKHLDKWIAAYEAAVQTGVTMFELPEHLRCEAPETSTG